MTAGRLVLTAIALLCAAGCSTESGTRGATDRADGGAKVADAGGGGATVADAGTGVCTTGRGPPASIPTTTRVILGKETIVPDLHGADLSCRRLGGLDFIGANLTGSNLTGADLTGVTLSDADLTGADLTGATLANVHGVGLRGCPAVLPEGSRCLATSGGGFALVAPGVVLDGADLSGADLAGADLTGVHAIDLTGCPGVLPAGVRCLATPVRGGSVLVGPGLSLSGADLAGADLTDVDLKGADLGTAGTADLRGCPAALPVGMRCMAPSSAGTSVLLGPGLNLSGAKLGGLDLRGVNLAAALLGGANLAKADLTGADLGDAYLESADFTGANLTTAILAAARLVTADLTGANLTGANLTGANLTGANLTGANLTGADLGPPKLESATVAGVVWTGATCPDGSRSDANGGTCAGHLWQGP
jgi:uncharacterized protein YjbI with pentapeptide repeats